MIKLLDANVLIALFDASHVHRPAVKAWFLAQTGFATCPVVEAALVRWVVHLEGSFGTSLAVAELRKLAADPRHRFWSDGLPLEQVGWDGVLGHRQVTDAYLAALARHHGGKVATLDQGFAALHHDVVELIPA